MASKLITNLSGGMNTETNPIALKDTQVELILNYRLDSVGSLTKRNGYDVFASQPIDDRRVLGLYQYTNTVTTAETTQVMVIDDANTPPTSTDIYYNNSGTWTTSYTADTYAATITNFNRYRFATFLDYLFRVNGRDPVLRSNDVNGGTWADTDNVPATIVPCFISVFTDRVYLANDKTAGAQHPSRVYYSSLPNAAGTAVTWDTTNWWLDVNPDDGDEITGLENNGNRLLIFKNRAMYRWNWGQIEPDRLIGVGTASQESVKTNLDLGITFFASQNGKGVYAYTGQRPVLISRKIQKWFDAVPAADWDDMVAEVDSDHYYLYLSDSLTVKGVGDNDEDRAFTNVMAVYTISLDAWVIYSLHTRWRFAAKLIQSAAENIYFGSHEGRTYQWDSGLEDDSGGASENTATPIHAEIISKEYLLTYPQKTNAEYIDFISKDAINTGAYYQLNRSGDFKTLGNLVERYKTAKHIGKECRSIRLKLSDNSAMASRIDGWNIEHTPQRERK